MVKYQLQVGVWQDDHLVLQLPFGSVGDFLQVGAVMLVVGLDLQGVLLMHGCVQTGATLESISSSNCMVSSVLISSLCLTSSAACS